MRFYLLLLLTSLLWASSFVAVQFMVGHGSPLVLSEVRWSIAVAVLLPLVWLREGRVLPPRQAWLPLVLMGLTGTMLFNWFMFLASERTTAANTGLLSALNPVSIALASFLLLRERLNLRQVGGMILSLLGVLVVITYGDWHRLTSLHFNAGDLWMLAAVAMWGLYSVAAKRAMRWVTPLQSTLWQGTTGLLLMLPFTWRDLALTETTPTFWAAALYVGIAATVIATVFWNMGVQRVGGTRAGMFLNFNPVFTAIIAFLLLDEQVTAYQLIGMAGVIAGVLLFTWASRPATHESIRPSS